MRIGEFVKATIRLINERQLWTNSVIEVLTDKLACNEQFGLHYPLLKKYSSVEDERKQRNAGTQQARYYRLESISVAYRGDTYYICNDLYERNKEALSSFFYKNFEIDVEGSMGKYFYVKLSCPKEERDSNFASIMEALSNNTKVETKLNNIPNSLEDSSVGDIIFLHMGGDASKKRSYFSNYNAELKDFVNGWYGIATLKEINVDQKEIVIECFPLNTPVTKMDLMFFPQFADNFGCATKGIPNQAGLYEIGEIEALGFADYLQMDGKLGKAEQLFSSIELSGWLRKGIEEFNNRNPDFAGLKSSSLLRNSFVGNRVISKNEKYSRNYIKGLHLSKPFLLLAGISGTGKTRFVREQAFDDLSNYQLVSVRPDWHEPSDLLGYVSRISGEEKYVTTDVLKFIAKAWRELIDSGVDISGTISNAHDIKTTVEGGSEDLEQISPYWLCLDEMNLAPVEQYFADYLSVSETRKWSWQGDKFEYCCDPLLTSSTINDLFDKGDSLREALELTDSSYDELWSLFKTKGIAIPFNLMVAGTVNMDETTHGFSRKVIDRALSFDFGEFYPNDFQKFFLPDTLNLKLSYPVWSDGRDLEALSGTVDGDGSRTVNFLDTVNKTLDGTPFQLAFRALNEILLSVIANKPQTERELMAVWDDFVMCKLLPRIEGDIDKLSSSQDESEGTILNSLLVVLQGQLGEIWEGDARPDLYREYTTEQAHPENAPQEQSPSKTVWIPCRSKHKLEWMQQRLEKDTFTSFWP